MKLAAAIVHARVVVTVLCVGGAVCGCKRSRTSITTSSSTVRSSTPAPCSWESIAFKQAEYEDMKRDWDAVSSRRWTNGGKPTNRVTFGLAENSSLDKLAQVLGNAEVMSINPASRAYRASFSSADAAVGAFRPLACESGVAWVAMTMAYDSAVQESD